MIRKRDAVSASLKHFFTQEITRWHTLTGKILHNAEKCRKLCKIKQRIGRESDKTSEKR